MNALSSGPNRSLKSFRFDERFEFWGFARECLLASEVLSRSFERAVLGRLMAIAARVLEWRLSARRRRGA